MLYTNLGGTGSIICVWLRWRTRSLCCVVCAVTTAHMPMATENSDLVTAAINGLVVTNSIPKSAYDTKRIFSCGPLPSLFTCEIFLAVFFSIHRERIKKIPACFCVSKGASVRDHRMIDEPVRPTVADAESWQKFSVTERNLKYLFHLLY